MKVYDEIMARATVLDNVGRRVVVSLRFVEADVKRPILSSAKMGEAGLMTCTGPTWSGLAVVQDVVLRPDAVWLPLVQEGNCYELKVAPPEGRQPAQALRHESVAVPRDNNKVMIAPVTDQTRQAAASSTSSAAANPARITSSASVSPAVRGFIELKLTASSELFTGCASRRACGRSSIVLAGTVYGYEGAGRPG